MKCGIKKGLVIFLALILSFCFVACGNSAEGEKDIEKDGVKQEESAKQKESAEGEDEKKKSSDKAENKDNEADTGVKEEKDAKDDKKSEEEPKDKPAKDENVKDEVPQKENEAESQSSEVNDSTEGDAESETPAEPQNEQKGSAEDEKKVADMVEMLNAVAGSMMSEEMKGDGSVQFRADGTRVVMVLTMNGYSAEHIKTKKEKFEQSWAEMTDSYGMVSMIKDTEPAVTSVSLEVYGNDGNLAFSKVL